MTDTTDTTETTVTITVDGTPFEARPGELVIEAVERAGTYIPRFCYHPRMEPVGMCRMCIVEIDTGRGPALQPSCMVPVSPDMVVSTASDTTKKAQDGILEFLLANHPLDCPVCDKGGECPLQDQAYSYGPGESRFVEEKRHFEKPIPISDLVHLDRERCILCDRCTRFASDVAGDALIHFQDRGNQTQVNTFPDHPFASYFSGNTVQICPVGALTAESYRFKARPWDLDQTESTCTTCSVGCRVVVQDSRNEVLRVQGVDVDAVNWGWLCDKGRFDFPKVHAPERLRTPAVRAGDGHEATGWADALGRAADAIRAAVNSSGPGGVAVIGGARATNESAYAWAKLAKGVIGTDNVDAQLGDGLPADAVLGLPRTTIDGLCTPGGVIVVIGSDPKEELGALYLRIRHAVVNDGATLIEVVPRRTGLSSIATHSLVHAPGAVADVVAALVAGSAPVEAVGGIAPEVIAAAAASLGDAPSVLLGRGSIADSADLVVAAATTLLDARPATRFLSGLRRGNVHGALDMGLSPGLLPGRVTLDTGREAFGAAWGTVPAAAGLDTAGILTAAADGKIDVLILLGADPRQDFPDADLATRALAGARTVIAVDTMPTASVAQADIVLPAAAWSETEGTTTNLEGRVSRVAQKVTPPGTARADWMIAAELGRLLGDDLGITSVADLRAEMAERTALFAGVDDDRIGIDGVVVPLPAEAAPEDEPSDDTDAAVDAEPDSTDDAATELDAADEAQTEGDAATGDDGSGDAAAPSAPARPAPDVTVRPRTVEVPRIDGYRLRLVATRRMYDQATGTQAVPALAGLASDAELHLHPYDFDRLGVTAGTAVTVSNRDGGRGTVSVPVQVDDGVPRGAAHLVINQAGGSAATLIDVARPVTDVRVEVS